MRTRKPPQPSSEDPTAFDDRLAATVVDDEFLLRRIGRGDRTAFDAFYRRHYVRVLRFAMRIAGDQDIVDEVINDTMLAVWDRADTFRGEARPTTWLLAIAWRSTKHRLRAARRWRGTVDIDDVPMADPSSPEADAADRQRARHLQACIASLSPTHRAVVELTYFHDYTGREIATILGCPEGTVRSRMLYARRRLRALLADLYDPQRKEHE
ncbi:MAG: sigma-70 family RNA polymerase sigma factor [Pseudomonadota bacterium]